MHGMSNIRVPNQDAQLQYLIAYLLQQADRTDTAAAIFRSGLFMPPAEAFDNIATCMREQANELKKHLILTILAEDHTP
ncbi:hypothetical protein CBI36_14740 [Acetobacter oryzifermentans]|uniref:Uncharacterized protein n=2 Tax=Acetobacter oryzifermentans TaxID=1633874 RepID=A0ABC8CB78_9PROT|nr:hypothetical protein CBI36_02875 [Acetobacter oryzifermentans]ASL41513.1 hypothetical protein CBI36_14740 [Acetobacter oryzifermentans]